MAKSKLTVEQWEEISRRVEAGETQTALAREFGVFSSGISLKLKRMKSQAIAADSVDVSPEVKESDAFLLAVQRLEDKFPGAVERIKKGYIVPETKLRLVKY